MSFTFNGVSFREEFPGCEAIQSEYPNLSNLSVDSLEIPRMERRRFLETTRPNTSIEFYVILRGDTPEELEETRQRFMLLYDPTLGPGRLVLDEDPDWFWEMTLADEIVWERLTWECGRAGNSGGYRLAADVKFESFNDAAQRLVEEAWGPAEPPPPPKWVEAGRNLLAVPQSENGKNVALVSNSAGSELDSPYAAYDATAPSGTKYSTQRVARANVTVLPTQSALYLSSGSLTLPATPGEERVFKVSLFSAEALSVELRVLYFREDGSNFTTERSGPSDIPHSEWVQLVFPSVAPDEAVKCRLGIYNMGELALSDSSLFKTDAWAFLTADVPWFSGDHAPDGMRSEWLGGPNNSVSVLYKLEDAPDDPDLPDVTSIRCEGNTRTWPTVQFTATATAAQTVRVTVGGFTVDVAGPFTAQDTAVLDYDLMRFELFREGVKVASLVPRMSTLDRLEIRPQDGWIPVTVEPMDGGTVSDVKVKPNSRKQ